MSFRPSRADKQDVAYNLAPDMKGSPGSLLGTSRDGCAAMLREQFLEKGIEVWPRGRALTTAECRN